MQSETFNSSNLDGIIRKIQGLLARAEHANTPKPEAEACRTKIELLMAKYRIEEIGVADAGGTKPVFRTFNICRVDGDLGIYYRQLWQSVLSHFECLGVTKYEHDADGELWYVSEACGFESDLRFAEILFLSAASAFGGLLEPKVDATLSDQVNAYRLRSAGMGGKAIALAIYGKDDKALRPKVRKYFEAESVLRGEDPSALLGKGNDVKGYRKEYARGFVAEMGSRLRSMRASRGEFAQGLVLSGRKEAIAEAFYAKNPTYRPAEGGGSAWIDPRQGCAKCAKAKSGYCREHNYLKPRYVTVKVNQAARDAGRSAARSVDLGSKGSGGRLS